ncbi:response regulator [Aphanothece sacrum]|nr:response regulator [Aphanothece sacrum]
MSNIKPNKITLRYLVLTSIGLIVAQLIFGIIQVRWRYYQSTENIRDRVQDLAKELRIISQESSLKLNDSTLERLMRQNSLENKLVYGIIINDQGQTITSFFNQEEKTISDAITTPNTTSIKLSKILETIKNNPKIREIRQPVIVSGESLGEIRLAYSLEPTDQETLKSASKIIIASLIVSGVLVIITVAMFKREIQRPLQILVKQAQDILPTDEVSDIDNKDELSQLQILIDSLRKHLERFENLQIKVTEQKATEKAIEELSKAKNEFLAMIGHEIRTPLNAVTGMTGLLLDTQLNPQQKEFVNIVRSSGESLLTMINNILDFSKIEAEKIELEEQPFELGPCIEEVLRLFVPQASDKKLELAYLIEPNTPSAIVGDSTRLKQILANLVGNAVKFTETGEVVIYINGTSLSQEEPTEESSPNYELRFAIKDTGIGIPNDRCHRLFQAFSQVDASTTRKYGGTGLGLVISKRLTELMGGKMWVHSTEGKGSTFYFTLQTKAAPSYCRATSQEGERELMGKRMLIIDDNLTNQKILTLQAQSWGMFTCAVDSGEKSLEWLDRGITFDVAILDMNMPQMDGLSLAKSIRQQPHCQNLPLVMLSSITTQEINQQSDYADFAAILIKPIRQTQLYNSLMQIFAGKPIIVTKSVKEASPEQLMADIMPLRILVAEDVGVNQEVIRLLLEKLGYWADMVSDGEEALDAIRNRPYDAVLMDVRMPVMDGLTATRQICQEIPNHKRPRIIAMTAESMRGDREKCLASGMDDYISKPIRIEELKQALRRCKPLAKMPALDGSTLNSLRKMAGKRAGEVINNLIMGYLEDAPLRLSAIKSAIAQNDPDALRQAAHALRSASINLGATDLSNLCQELEMMGRKGTMSGANKKMSVLKMEYDRVCQTLQKELIKI